jgi:hypothetical protein
MRIKLKIHLYYREARAKNKLKKFIYRHPICTRYDPYSGSNLSLYLSAKAKKPPKKKPAHTGCQPQQGSRQGWRFEWIYLRPFDSDHGDNTRCWVANPIDVDLGNIYMFTLEFINSRVMG